MKAICLFNFAINEVKLSSRGGQEVEENSNNSKMQNGGNKLFIELRWGFIYTLQLSKHVMIFTIKQTLKSRQVPMVSNNYCVPT